MNTQDESWKFKSKSELRRALKAGMIKINGKKVGIEYMKYFLKPGDTVQIGKGRKIVVTNEHA